MSKEKKPSFTLNTVDDMFTTQEIRDERKLPRIRDIPIKAIKDFPDHPYKVKDDEDMMNLMESIKENGVLTPVTVRKIPGGSYEMISGHRRKRACELLGMPVIRGEVVELDRDEAIIMMCDSNLQRTTILPSEKAFAYKMRLEAMKRLPGRPKDNLRPVGADLIGTRSDELLAENSPDSARQIQRYIRLTHLTPEILDLVDNSVLREKDTLQISLRPAVELSYLSEKEQQDLFEIMESEDCTPSHAQAIKMRQFSQEGRLDANVLLSIMQEEKPNQVEQFKMPKERISKFFSPGTPAKKMEDTIVKALELYRKRQRDVER